VYNVLPGALPPPEVLIDKSTCRAPLITAFLRQRVVTAPDGTPYTLNPQP